MTNLLDWFLKINNKSEENTIKLFWKWNKIYFWDSKKIKKNFLIPYNKFLDKFNILYSK